MNIYRSKQTQFHVTYHRFENSADEPLFTLPCHVSAGALPWYPGYGKGSQSLCWCNRLVLKAVWFLSGLHCCSCYFYCYCCYSVEMYSLHLPVLPLYRLLFHSSAGLGKKEMPAINSMAECVYFHEKATYLLAVF